MKIGSIDEFKASQTAKVKMRQEEDKKIKKGIYQMHVMVQSECMETLNEEQKKADSRKESAKSDKENTNTEQKEEKNTDIQNEIEKLLSMGSKHYKTTASYVKHFDESNSPKEETDYQQFFQEHMQELLEKIKSGDTEESFQIGASSFTLKEWKSFLEKFDAVEDDVKRMLKGMIEEEIKERKKAEASAGEKQLAEEI